MGSRCGHQQFRFVGGGLFGHAAQNDRGSNRCGVVHIVRPGHVEHRFAQFRGATDRFIDGIEAGNASQKDVFSFR